MPPEKVDYAEIQQNEVEALRAIYMDEYEEIPTASAWNKTAAPAFILHMKATEYPDPPVSVDLQIQMTSTYPKTAPTINLTNAVTVLGSALTKLKTMLNDHAKSNLGSEMIYDLAVMTQDFLNECQADARKRAASLGDERAKRLDDAERLAEEAEEKRRKEREEALLEENRVLEALIQEELKRKKERLKEISQEQKIKQQNEAETHVPVVKGMVGEVVTFDRVTQVKQGAQTLTFKSVTGLVLLGRGGLVTVRLVKPIVEGSGANTTLVLKEVDLLTEYWESLEGKKLIQKLERELDTIRALDHPYIARVYDFRVSRQTKGWTIQVLEEYCNGGSMYSLLDTVGTVSPRHARHWMSQLLEGLCHIHKHGFIHRGIRLGCVLLSSEDEEKVAKLSDACFSQRLHEMNDTHPFTSEKHTYQDHLPISEGWYPPETVRGSDKRSYSRKTDIWNLGIVFVQMVYDKEVVVRYRSPNELIKSRQVAADPLLRDFLARIFHADYRKRASADELLHDQYFRQGMALASPVEESPYTHFNSLLSPVKVVESEPEYRGSRSPTRQVSSTSSREPALMSRYKTDFEELEFLGKGGFGEVVKARNRLDGRLYAIKKVKLGKNENENTRILREVMTLSRLHHQYVVRYFTTWLERASPSRKNGKKGRGTETETETETDLTQSLSFGVDEPSEVPIDFMSSSGFRSVRFAESESDDSDSDDSVATATVDNDSDEDSDSEDEGKKSPGTLFIQMEYCEKQTLRDAIRDGISKDDAWRLFRQVLEGLLHVHSQNMIHRDLKPNNIFLDDQGDVKIGDFGLATTSHTPLEDVDTRLSASMTFDDGDDFTSGLGTALYMAPEVASKSNTKYTSKVDIYSLGIILFEMVYPLTTAMERVDILRRLRAPEPEFPPNFPTDLENQRKVIQWCLQHVPSDRPSSSQLLQSNLLPTKIEDEYIQESIRTLTNPNTPHFARLMAQLFGQSGERVRDRFKDLTYDFAVKVEPHQQYEVLFAILREHLSAVFRRHGAVETLRNLLIPASPFYANSPSVVTLMDRQGSLVQLPYDLTLPYARSIARSNSGISKTFTFGSVYRENTAGGQPRAVCELDFDIVAPMSVEPTLCEAEVLKVIDEVIESTPSLASRSTTILLNHSDILDAILDYCGIDEKTKPSIIHMLGQSGGMLSMAEIKLNLRSTVSGSILDELSLFDFRDDFEKGIQRLLHSFARPSKIVTGAVEHLRVVASHMKHMNVKRPVQFMPLCVYNPNAYRGGIMFQAVVEGKRRDLIAAGGRYDTLVEYYSPHRPMHHAVGCNIAVEKILSGLANYQKTASAALRTRRSDLEPLYGPWVPRRCDILVASFGKELLRERLEIVQELWSHGIRAELAHNELYNAHTPEDLGAATRADGVCWIIIVKQKHSDHARREQQAVKVKNLLRRDEEEVPRAELVTYFQGELAERTRRDALGQQVPRLAKHTSNTGDFFVNDTPSTSRAPSSRPSMDVRNSKAEINVTVLSQDKHRKNKLKAKQVVTNKAYESVQDILSDLNSGEVGVIALEIGEDLFQKLKMVKLNDDDAWKTLIMDAPAMERPYLNQLRTELEKLAKEGKKRIFLHCWKAAHSTHLYELS
ncbi:hypothetical protein G7K_4601-t1 [Saitoella complicata NRRL Y-17804]|uniref:non-specific serine/threonine protein kinase n=1 Tax=Saitoella complicata (strain BCRC 22490 / CBS 7301 / JCM 7358 / NBRC 10748 / NRRL Y-17804) TaxID=698492 RepID=A0A0E9NKS6_SAICN|nr:hypothetical protein G7K_4601-t1 [Saitoella complicata NRRL Y-17804]